MLQLLSTGNNIAWWLGAHFAPKRNDFSFFLCQKILVTYGKSLRSVFRIKYVGVELLWKSNTSVALTL